MARTLKLPLSAPRTWGGRRTGAGWKPAAGRRPRVPHRQRPPHTAAHPLHVTLRTGPAIRCLRSERVFPAVRHALAASSHSGFRILQFSVQDDHLHLIVEADDAPCLRRGLRGLSIRVARAVNRALGRRGAVWQDRYHARALTTPRAVRNALVYVLNEYPETPRGRDRFGSLLIGRVLRRLETVCRGGIHTCAGGPSAYLACGRRLAAARPARNRRAAASVTGRRCIHRGGKQVGSSSA